MMHGYNYMWNYIILGLVFLFIIALYVSNDATKRGYNGTLWALVVILMPMMGIFFYLILISVSPYQMEGNRYQSMDRRNPTPTPNHYQSHNADYNSNSKESFYCTSCGLANSLSNSFCKKCGTKLS